MQESRDRHRSYLNTAKKRAVVLTLEVKPERHQGEIKNPTHTLVNIHVPSFCDCIRRLAAPAIVLALAASHTVFADCLPPPAGLVSWWRAETNVFDAVGGNPALAFGPLTYTAGEAG